MSDGEARDQLMGPNTKAACGDQEITVTVVWRGSGFRVWTSECSVMIRVGFCDVRPKSQQTCRLMNLLVSQLLNRLNPADKGTGRTQRAGPSLVAAS